MLRWVVNNFLGYEFSRMNADKTESVFIRDNPGLKTFSINFKADIHYRSDVFLE
jgi:hypothetical protein